MGVVCPQCSTPIIEDFPRCLECGAELDGLHTMGLPSPKKVSTSKAPKPPKPAPTAREDEPDEYERPPVVPKPKPKPKPKPPSQAAPPSQPQPAYGPQPQPQPQPPPGGYFPQPPYPQPAYPQQPPGSPTPGVAPGQSGVRGWLIRKLGGDGPQAPGAQGYVGPYAPPPQPPQPAAPWVQSPAAAPGMSWPQPPQAPNLAAGTGDFAAPAAPMPKPQPIEGPSPFGYPADGGDDDGRTQYMGGIDIEKLKIPKSSFQLEILDRQGQWCFWSPIQAKGLNVGRSQKTAQHFPALGSMAERHMRLSYENSTLMVEDLGSMNGVYLRIDGPVELADGMRFRIGNQVIAFRHPGAFQAVLPAQSPDGEEFWSRDLEPLAFLDLIRPDNTPGLRFPITKPDQVVIGREGPGVDLALVNDKLVSAPHARVRAANGHYLLEDMNSRNGTFAQVVGAAPLKSGDILLVGRVLLRVMAQGG